MTIHVLASTLRTIAAISWISQIKHHTLCRQWLKLSWFCLYIVYYIYIMAPVITNEAKQSWLLLSHQSIYHVARRSFLNSKPWRKHWNKPTITIMKFIRIFEIHAVEIAILEWKFYGISRKACTGNWKLLPGLMNSKQQLNTHNIVDVHTHTLESHQVL